MKILTAILLGSLISVQADTVYLNNVSTSEFATFTPGLVDPTGQNGQSGVSLQDDHLISSITIQAFFTVFDANGHVEVTPPMDQSIFMTGAFLKQ